MDCYSRLMPVHEGEGPSDLERECVIEGARHAWKFADELLDVSPRRESVSRLGDPGPSRWKPSRRRR